MSKVVITRSKLDSLATTISAKSGEPLPLTIAQMDAAVQGIETDSTLVVTLSYNESTQMWEPDKTYAEIEAAYTAGKTVVVEVANGYVSWEQHTEVARYEFVDAEALFAYTVLEYSTHTFVSNWATPVIGQSVYILNANGLSISERKTYMVPNAPKTFTGNGEYNVTPLKTVTVNVPDSTLVVTLSYNDQTSMWEPDNTFAEIQAAYEDGKTVVFECTRLCWGAYSSEYNQVEYSVYDDGPVIRSMRERFYVLNSDGLTEQESHPVYDVYMATAVESDVAQGKVFVNSTGYHTGTATTPTPSLQSKSVSYTPSETAQSATVTADSGYDGLSSVAVSVGAISSTYVGSGITRRSSTDLTASGATVTVPAGYYSAQASKAVASGTAGTPTATKGTVSNHSVSVTPSVTNTTGYITGGTKNGTAITVSASELVSGSQTITANGTVNVTNLASVTVDIDFVTYHTSTSAPTSSQGSDGDIWLVTE